MKTYFIWEVKENLKWNESFVCSLEMQIETLLQEIIGKHLFRALLDAKLEKITKQTPREVVSFTNLSYFNGVDK